MQGFFEHHIPLSRYLTMDQQAQRKIVHSVKKKKRKKYLKENKKPEGIALLYTLFQGYHCHCAGKISLLYQLAYSELEFAPWLVTCHSIGGRECLIREGTLGVVALAEPETWAISMWFVSFNLILFFIGAVCVYKKFHHNAGIPEMES